MALLQGAIALYRALEICCGLGLTASPSSALSLSLSAAQLLPVIRCHALNISHMIDLVS